MGVLNVTPDSFSDGGRFLDPDDAVAQADGWSPKAPTLIDVGGESTRPGSKPVSPENAASIRVAEKLGYTPFGQCTYRGYAGITFERPRP